jgi:DNA damage-binding protein 1
VITASGTESSGSLRIIRSGVNVETLAELDLEHDSTSMWSVGAASDGSRLFILDTSVGRKFWLLSADGQLQDLSEAFQAAGIAPSDSTLAVSGLAGRPGTFVLVAQSAVYLVSIASGVASAFAHKLDGKATAAAATESGKTLVATSTLQLLLLQVTQDGSFALTASATVSNPISCLHVQQSSGLAAAGFWENQTVELYRLPSLECVTPRTIKNHALPTLPTSILLQSFDSSVTNTSHLAVGLGNGSVVIFTLSLPGANSVSGNIVVLEQKEASIGNRPVILQSLQQSTSINSIFACCDRPTMISLDAERRSLLTYSAVQAKDVRAVSQLSVADEHSSRCVAMLLPDKLQLATLGEVQRLDIQRVDLGAENPVALAQHPAASCIAVATWMFLPYGKRSSISTGRSSVKLFDQGTFELLDSFHMREVRERVNCVESMELHGKSHVVVGTGRSENDQSETTEGRVVGFEVRPDPTDSSRSRILHQAFAIEGGGNVYAVARVGDRVAAAINSDVIVYDCSGTALKKVSEWGCAFIACTLSNPDPLGTRLVVGDAMRSMSVLRVESNGRITELARDGDPYWTTAADMLDEDSQLYIGSDISFNVYTSQRALLTAKAKKRLRELRQAMLERGTAAGEADTSAKRPSEQKEDEKWSHVMRRAGVWHYGDMINKFRRGELSVSSR